MEKELQQFEKYLLDPGTEKAKDHLVFPLFQKLFGSKFKKESDAEGADIYIEGKLLVELKTGDCHFKSCKWRLSNLGKPVRHLDSKHSGGKGKRI
jgi:hypothetical protein